MQRFFTFLSIAVFFTGLCASIPETVNAASPKDFIDTWEGEWIPPNHTPQDAPDSMPSKLIVKTVGADGTTTGQFSWEAVPKWQVDAGEFSFRKGMITGRKLVIDALQGRIFEFKLESNGTLTGKRLKDGILTIKAIMHRTQGE